MRSYLSTQLSTLLPAGSNRLADVQQGHAVTFAGYPACRFYYLSAKEVLEDNRNKWRSYNFQIDLIYKLAGEDKSVAESTLEDAMEAVLNALDADFTFGGHADNTEINAERIREVEAPYGVSLVLPIFVSAFMLQFF